MLEVSGPKITERGAELNVYRRRWRSGLTVGEHSMEVACQDGRPSDRPAAAINHAVVRILMFMDHRGDKRPFRFCKDGRGFKGIQKRVLHARREVECECEAVNNNNTLTSSLLNYCS